MEGFTSLNRDKQTNRAPEQLANDNGVKALKSLAMLLLREVENLENSIAFTQESVRNGDSTLAEDVQRFEIDLIRYALIQCKGNQLRAAELLGTKATTLHAKIKRYGIGSHSLVEKLTAELGTSQIEVY